MASYIGGTANEARRKYIAQDTKLVSIVNRLSQMYGINPILMLNRLSKEGIIDRAIQAHNSDIKNKITPKSIVDRGNIDIFKDLGLDDSYTHIQNGSIKLLRDIPYTKVSQKNSFGRTTYGAQAETAIDNLEIMAAQLKAFQDQSKAKHPELKGDKLDIYTNAVYNMGAGKTNEHYKKGTIKLDHSGKYGFHKNLRALNVDSLYNLKAPRKLEDTNIINRALVKLGIRDYDINNEYKDVDGTMKKFGGKLRYGWGGIYSPDDLTPTEYITGEKGNSGYGHHSARYYVDKGYQSADNLYTYRPGEGYVSYNNMTNEEKDNVLSGWDDWAVDTTINGFPLSTKSVQRLYKFDDKSLAEIESKRLKSINIFNNMQDRINKDIAIHRQVINANQIAKYGGLIGFRKRYDTGGFNYNTTPYSGNLSWGMKVKPEDISYSRYNADNEGIYGKNIANYASSVGGLGMGLGTTIGLASGAGMAAAGPIGLAIGALLGAGIGALVGKNEKKNLEEERRNKLAELDELNRQQTLNSMQNRYENDVARIRTFNNNMSFNNSGFYTKYGGLIKPRIKYANGGTILPNSSDTAIAYGRTHEQVDPITGETGITYGNAEVEGGGLVGGKELPGEVIQQTSNGDRIYSDSLYVPGTRATYAQIAKALTDKKGIIEQEISTLHKTLDTSLNAFNKAKLAKAKAGTATRNIEKLASKLNLKTGELAQVDAQLNDVFTNQEQMATALGLRDTAPVTARFGGYRPKYKFGIPEMGLITNGLSFIGNMISTGLSSKNNLAQLDFLSKLSVPKTNKVEAEYHTVDTRPYEEASHKMAAETRRFNKWIEDNVSNPQVLRNQKRKNLINYYEGLSDINAKKSAYLTFIYDANRNARIAARNANNQGKYQDALNEYNKNMQIANARMSINNQTTQNYMASINQLMQAVGSYGNQKMYLASLPEGVQKEFYFGRRKTRLPE